MWPKRPLIDVSCSYYHFSNWTILHLESHLYQRMSPMCEMSPDYRVLGAGAMFVWKSSFASIIHLDIYCQLTESQYNHPKGSNWTHFVGNSKRWRHHQDFLVDLHLISPQIQSFYLGFLSLLHQRIFWVPVWMNWGSIYLNLVWRLSNNYSHSVIS